jgi:hypothetical protein
MPDEKNTDKKSELKVVRQPIESFEDLVERVESRTTAVYQSSIKNFTVVQFKEEIEDTKDKNPLLFRLLRQQTQSWPYKPFGKISYYLNDIEYEGGITVFGRRFPTSFHCLIANVIGPSAYLPLLLRTTDSSLLSAVVILTHVIDNVTYLITSLPDVWKWRMGVVESEWAPVKRAWQRNDMPKCFLRLFEFALKLGMGVTELVVMLPMFLYLSAYAPEDWSMPAPFDKGSALAMQGMFISLVFGPQMRLWNSLKYYIAKLLLGIYPQVNNFIENEENRCELIKRLQMLKYDLLTENFKGEILELKKLTELLNMKSKFQCRLAELGLLGGPILALQELKSKYPEKLGGLLAEYAQQEETKLIKLIELLLGASRLILIFGLVLNATHYGNLHHEYSPEYYPTSKFSTLVCAFIFLLSQLDPKNYSRHIIETGLKYMGDYHRNELFSMKNLFSIGLSMLGLAFALPFVYLNQTNIPEKDKNLSLLISYLTMIVGWIQFLPSAKTLADATFNRGNKERQTNNRLVGFLSAAETYLGVPTDEFNSEVESILTSSNPHDVESSPNAPLLGPPRNDSYGSINNATNASVYKRSRCSIM